MTGRLTPAPQFLTAEWHAEKHPVVPGDLFTTLIPRAGHSVWRLSSHPSIPSGVLAKLAASADERHRNVAAISPHLPAPVAAELAKHPVATTRRSVAGDEALPLPDVLRLLHDPDSAVVTAAASNPAFPPARAAELIRGAGPLRCQRDGGATGNAHTGTIRTVARGTSATAAA